MRPGTEKEQVAHRSVGLLLLRYGIGAVMVLAGIVMLIVDPSGLGVSGDRERETEERARAYFDEHGEWPEEEERVRERKWRLAPGVHTLEDEQAERRPR